jgi:hypothetical protein
MATSIDPSTGDILIGGFEQGIGDSPYSGLTDMRNVNISSVPSEAAINFATSLASPPAWSGTVVSAGTPTANTVTYTGATGTSSEFVAITFSGSSLPTGITAGKTYFAYPIGTGTFLLYNDPFLENAVNITATGVGTFSTVQMGTPIHWTYQTTSNTALVNRTFLLDNNGRVWANNYYDPLWFFTGNTLQSDSAYANGLVWYEGANPAPQTCPWTAGVSSANTTSGIFTFDYPSGNIQSGDPIQFSSISGLTGIVVHTMYWINNVTNTTFTIFADPGLTTQVIPSTTGTGTVQGNYNSSAYQGYLILFRGSAIDYMNVTSFGWQYNWWPLNPAITSMTTPYLNSPSTAGNSHYALVGQDNAIYYCDGNYLGSITQLYSNYPFDPANVATYTWASQALELPSQDCTTWLAEQGALLLISGVRNYIYPWDRITSIVDQNTGLTQTTFGTPILVGESNITRMITVNTNTYLFAGNRGRIYITNGSQVQLWKKIPDHLSGVVEPYYVWGAIGYSQNKLYFGFSTTTNSGSALNSGGLWAIDTNTQALTLSNILSYGTYGGYASIFIPNPPQGPTLTGGNAFFVGWNNGSINGIDISTNAIYTGGQSYIVSDMIATGTALSPSTASQIEFKLSTPLKTGESVELLMGSSLNDLYGSGSMTHVGTTTGTGVELFGNFPITVQAQQWLLVQAKLTYINGTPSYNRIVSLRIIGATVTETHLYSLK